MALIFGHSNPSTILNVITQSQLSRETDYKTKVELLLS